MASKNEVTLTFAGDSEKLEKAFDDVGAAAKGMAGKVDSASTDIESSFDRAGSATDNLDDKAGGMESTFQGTSDVMTGFSDIAKGDVLAGMTDMAGGISSLAAGFTTSLIPALQKSWAWLAKTKVGMLAQAATTKVVGAATKVWTAIQAAFNFVMALNPIVLIVIAVIALIAVIIIAYKKSETFRKIVDAAFRWVLKVVKGVWNWIKDNWKLLLAIITGPIGLAVRFVMKHWNTIKSGVSKLWGYLKSGFRKVTSWITAPFRAGFQAVRSLWNRWLGGKGFTIRVPNWVPVVGGNSYSFRIPKFHQGGIMPGAPGTEGLALLQAGERITPAGVGGGGTVITVAGGDRGTSVERAVASMFLQLLRTGALKLTTDASGRVAGA